MPHKHTRRDDNKEHYNLEPSTIAKPLPVGKSATIFTSDNKKKSKRQTSNGNANNSNGNYKHDDTPKAFARLMQRSSSALQQTKKPTRGPDNGEQPRSNKKRKRSQAENPASTKPEAAPTAPPVQQPNSTTVTLPKILPGERLADFSARVDQALPLAGLAKKGKKDIAGMPAERRTKTEKRLHKMYDEWRKEELRIQEKNEEDAELREEEEEEQRELYGEEVVLPVTETRKNKRKRLIGEQKDVDDDDRDPWKVLESRREKPKGLHDVVQAPPEFKVVPKEKFKVKHGARVEVADVPSAAGSLKRREELGAERKNIIEQYRALMGRSLA